MQAPGETRGLFCYRISRITFRPGRPGRGAGELLELEDGAHNIHARLIQNSVTCNPGKLRFGEPVIFVIVFGPLDPICRHLRPQPGREG